MYTIKTRPDSPNYYIQIFGRLISLKTANLRLAKKKARQVEEYMILNDFRRIKPIRINKVALAVKEEIHKDYTPTSAPSYCQYVDKFLEYINPTTFLHDITPLMIVDYLREYGRTHTASTLRKCKRSIRLLFYFGELHGHIEKNPVDGMAVHTHKSKIKTKPAKSNKPIPWEFIQLLLDKAPPEYKTWWTVMAYTGLDPQDASNIEAHQVVDGLIIGKDRAKTGEPILIPIHEKLLNMDIIRAIKYNARVRAASMFDFKRILKEIGYSPNVNYKCLRHSYNTMLNYHGISQIERAKMLGQSSTTTNEVYTHGEIDRLRQAINLIP